MIISTLREPSVSRRIYKVVIKNCLVIYTLKMIDIVMILLINVQINYLLIVAVNTI